MNKEDDESTIVADVDKNIRESKKDLLEKPISEEKVGPIYLAYFLQIYQHLTSLLVYCAFSNKMWR